MSTASKIWTVIIILLVIAGVWWYVSAGNAGAPVTAPVSAGNVSGDNAPTELPTASTDDSNAALDQDMNSMDMQMNSLNTDAQNVNVSVASSTTGQ